MQLVAGDFLAGSGNSVGPLGGGGVGAMAELIHQQARQLVERRIQNAGLSREPDAEQRAEAWEYILAALDEREAAVTLRLTVLDLEEERDRYRQALEKIDNLHQDQEGDVWLIVREALGE